MPLSPAVTGFRTGVSIVENARPHVGKDMVVNVDIDAFFPSTGYEQILKVCQRLPGLSIPAAKLVADICSYQGALPTGAPTSPSIANLVLGRFDRALLTASKKYDITYTRYADDLTFSGNGDTHKIIPFAQKLLKEYGYVLSAKKTNRSASTAASLILSRLARYSSQPSASGRMLHSNSRWGSRPTA